MSSGVHTDQPKTTRQASTLWLSVQVVLVGSHAEAPKGTESWPTVVAASLDKLAAVLFCRQTHQRSTASAMNTARIERPEGRLAGLPAAKSEPNPSLMPRKTFPVCYAQSVDGYRRGRNQNSKVPTTQRTNRRDLNPSEVPVEVTFGWVGATKSGRSMSKFRLPPVTARADLTYILSDICQPLNSGNTGSARKAEVDHTKGR